MCFWLVSLVHDKLVLIRWYTIALTSVEFRSFRRQNARYLNLNLVRYRIDKFNYVSGLTANIEPYLFPLFLLK